MFPTALLLLTATAANPPLLHAQEIREGLPGTPNDISQGSKPAVDTMEQVRLRNSRNEAAAPVKSPTTEETCLLPPLSLVKSPTVPAGRLAVPAKPKKEYTEACAALKDKKYDIAEKHLRKAVQEFPNYSAAWVTLGQLLGARQKSDDSRSACSQASTVDATYVPAYLCLADIAARAHAWDDVLKLSTRALELDPANNVLAYEYNAAANLKAHNLDAAEQSALRAVDIDKTNSEPRAHFVLAQVYEAKGDRANEAAQLHEYLKYASNAEDVTMVKQYLAALEGQSPK